MIFGHLGDIDGIMDGYVRLISSAQYDSSLRNVKLESYVKDSEPLGRVEMTLEKNITSKRTVTVLTTKEHGYLAIEIYGNTELVEKRLDDINAIFDTLSFSTNKHNYSKDKPKEIDPEEERQAIENISKILDIKAYLSGDKDNKSGE